MVVQLKKTFENNDNDTKIKRPNKLLCSETSAYTGNETDALHLVSLVESSDSNENNGVFTLNFHQFQN